MKSVKFAACGAVALGISAAFAGNVPLVTDGLSAHVDASDSTSLTVVDGLVTAWKSSVGWSDGSDMVFVPLNHHDGTQEYGKAPAYDATAFGGRGAIHFGFNASGATEATVLNAWIPSGLKFTNAVVYIVAATDASQGCNYDNLYGRSHTGSENWLALFGKEPVYSMKPSMAYFWGSGSWFASRMIIDGVTEITANDVRNSYDAPFTKGELHVFHAIWNSSPVWSYGRSNDHVYSGPTIGHHRMNSNYYWRGHVCEVLVYAEQQDDFTQKYIETALDAKWRATKVCTWKGGASGNWFEAANWDGGVPGANDAALVDADVALTVNGDVNIRNFLVTPGHAGSLTIAGHKFLTKMSAVPKDYALNFSGTTTFAAGDVLQVFPLPENVTVNGTLIQAGGALLKLAKPIAGDFVYDSRNGDLDLNGFDQTFLSVNMRRLRNTDDEKTATVTVAADAADGLYVAEAYKGKIKLVLDGSKTVSALSLDNLAAVEVKGGALNLVTNLDLSVTSGLVFRLDASRLDTMTTNADGYVTSWRSTAYTPIRFVFGSANPAVPYPYVEGAQAVFTNAYVGEQQDGYDINYPRYQADRYNGKPGVVFGVAADGVSKEYSFLYSPDCSAAIGTYFVVMGVNKKPTSIKSYDKIFGRLTANYDIMLLDRDKMWVNGKDARAGTDFWINGMLKYRHNAYTNGFTTVGVPQDKQFVVCGEYSSMHSFYQPTIGGAYLSGTFHLSGSVSEFVAYDRQLTEAERASVEAYLLNKWGVARDAQAEEPVLVRTAETPDLKLGDGAKVELSGAALTAEKVTVDGAAAVTGGSFAFDAMEAKVGETLAKLAVDGDVDVTGASLSFTGGKPTTGVFLTTTGLLTGPFAEVTGTDRDIRYAANSARFPSGLILFLK